MHKTKPTFLIVWHSRTSASEQCAISAYQSAISVLHEMQAETKVQIRRLHANDVNISDLLTADAYLFCAPENLGSLSGEMKAFFDRNYYAALDQLNGRPYSAIICAGTAGHGAVKQVTQIATGWRLELIHPITIINTRAQTTAEILAIKKLDASQIANAAEIGGLLAAQLALHN